MSNIIEATDETFQDLVFAFDGTVFVDFYAHWCGPCKVQSTVIAEIAPEFPDVLFLKVNIEEALDTGFEYKVQALPTIMKLVDGVVTDSHTGLKRQDALRQWLSD